MGINSVLLTVLGFVVGLALSFRSSTAYERYNDGRKYWAQLTLVSQSLARLIWVHADEREGDIGNVDLLAKISCLNLIVAYSVALKHKLRFEPHTDYPDLVHLVSHLNTLAKPGGSHHSKKKSPFKVAGEFLGVPMAESNPRKLVKNPSRPLGNLPLEILAHLSGYIKAIFDNGTFKVSIYQTQALNALHTMNDVMTGTERVLNTPLPIAYSIAIGQITWVYILLLPFQLYIPLGWIAIPGTIVAAYIILGIALIGREIENPFGHDVNDLPLDTFCQQIREDIDIIMRIPGPNTDWMESDQNMVLWPLSHLGYQAWKEKGTEGLREALAMKPDLAVKSESNGPIASHHEVEGQV